MKPKNPPPTESLVYRAWERHGVRKISQAVRGRDSAWNIPDLRFAFFPADQYGPVDTILGTDTHLYVRLDIKYRRKGSNDIYVTEHWECIPIQIKGGTKCAFAIMPLPDPLPKSLRDVICPRMRRKAFVHYQRHRTVNSVLFVPKCAPDDPNFDKMLDEIWETTLKLVNMKFEIIGLKHRVK